MLWCGTVDIDSFEFRPKSSHTLRMPLHTRDKNSHIFAQIRPSPKWIRWHLLPLGYPKGSCHIVQSIAKPKKTLETYNPPNPSPSSLLHKQSQPWQTSSMQHYYETFKRRRKWERQDSIEATRFTWLWYLFLRQNRGRKRSDASFEIRSYHWIAWDKLLETGSIPNPNALGTYLYVSGRSSHSCAQQVAVLHDAM